MSRPSIIDKIGEHLERHMPPREECHVLYLMAEIRKVVEHDNSKQIYPALRFYSDWCVHTHLDRIPNFINEAADEIEKEIQAWIENGSEAENWDNVIRFLSMEALKQSLEAFLCDNNLCLGITDGENWNSFQGLLVEIISEQPIVNPSNRIAAIVYDDGGNGVIEFEIEPQTIKRFDFRRSQA